MEENNIELQEPIVSFEEEPTKPERKRIYQHLIGIGIIIFFYVTQFISSLILGIYIYTQYNGIETQEKLINVALSDMFKAMAIVEILSLIGIAYVYRKAIVKGLKAVRDNVFPAIIKLASYYAMFLVIAIGVGLIDSAFLSQYAEVAGDNQEIIEQAILSGTSFWMILSIGVTGPMFEEFVFRYGMMSKVLYGVNRYLAAVIAAVIFSFIHIGFSQATTMSFGEFAHVMLTYIPAALCFGIVYAREENLFYPIALHMINNIQAIIIIIIAANYL